MWFRGASLGAMGVRVDWSLTIGIGGSLLTIIGLVLTVRSIRRKQLVYETTMPVTVAQAVPGDAGRRLSIQYESPEFGPALLNGVRVSYLRLGNMGRETIMRSDLTGEDPLRIEVMGTQVVEVAIEAEPYCCLDPSTAP